MILFGLKGAKIAFSPCNCVGGIKRKKEGGGRWGGEIYEWLSGYDNKPRFMRANTAREKRMGAEIWVTIEMVAVSSRERE